MICRLLEDRREAVPGAAACCMCDLERLIEVADATAAKRSATFIDEMCQMIP
jgi:hypothetical protein